MAARTIRTDVTGLRAGANILALSHNSQLTLQSCPRKLQFRKMYNASRREESLPGDAGNALHNAMYSWLVGDGKELATWELMRRYPIRFQKSAMEARSLQACYATLLALMDYQGLANYRVAQVKHGDTVSPAIEVPFQINLLDHNGEPYYLDTANKDWAVIWVGWIDMILYNEFTGEYIVVDIKTTRYNLTDYVVLYQFDTQTLPYALVLERALGRPIDSLQAEYLVAYIDTLEPRVQKLPFLLTRESIQEWAMDLSVDLQALRTYTATNWFPRRSKSCYAFNRICQHFEYCEYRDSEIINHYLTANNLHGEPENPEDYVEPWFALDLQLAV